MKIPVENIYYLLCYAWNKLVEQRLVAVDAESCSTLPELFARVLHGGVSYLLKKGLDRNYMEYEEAVQGARGKIDFTASIKKNLIIRQHTWCRYDDLSHDILHNQILKTTIDRLSKLKELDPVWKAKLRLVYDRFQEVSEVSLTPQVFKRIQLHRNNQFYEFLIRICELLYHSMLPLEDSGRYRFQDFTRDDQLMAAVFEEFVRNFYKQEQQEFTAKRENISWQYSSTLAEAGKLLPKMETDISFRKPGQLIIMDCKYYRDIFERRFERDKFRSAHIYQLHAYLTQAAKLEPAGTNISGILLYAAGHHMTPMPFDSQEGLSLEFRTLNLAQHWSGVRKELLDILAIL